MIALRQRTSKSWLDTRHAPCLGAKLATRLIERCRGETGVFITLTYRRDEWESPQDLYQDSSRDRHVRRFMERLGRLLGESLVGRWLCKLEFQQGGWVHWHIILLGRKFIDHGLLTHAWGFGHVWIASLTRSRIRYTCKYVAKADELPTYLYFEPIRSVKIVRVSSGFWDNENPEPRPPRDPPDRTQRLSAYIPIGSMIARSEHETVAQDEETGRFGRIPGHVSDTVLMLLQHGAKFVRFERGWVWLDNITWITMNWRASRAAAARQSLYLKEHRNPPSQLGWSILLLGNDGNRRLT